MDNLSKLPVPVLVSLVIIGLCYAVAEGYKKLGTNHKVVPLISATAGVLLGITAFLILPTTWTTPIVTIGSAAFVGGTYGALCTWIYELLKTFREKKNNWG